MSLAASPSRRSDQGRVHFSARTLLFLVDPEKSCLDAMVPQREIVVEIRRSNHNRRQQTHATAADSSGSFLRRTRQTLNISKSVRNWTPNRGEVDRYVSLAASPSRRSYHGRVLFSARTLKSHVWALWYRNAGLPREYAGQITTVGTIHTLPTLIVPVRFYEELVKR